MVLAGCVYLPLPTRHALHDAQAQCPTTARKPVSARGVKGASNASFGFNLIDCVGEFRAIKSIDRQ
jgi:hypothetical protein